MPFASVSGCRMHGVLIEHVSGLAVACQLSLGLTGPAMGRPQKARGFSEPPRSGLAVSVISRHLSVDIVSTQSSEWKLEVHP